MEFSLDMVDSPWKSFEDVTPREPRSVITHGGGAGLLLVYEGRTKRQRTDETVESWSNDFVSSIHVEIDGDEMHYVEAWSEASTLNGWTHWAYVDLPEAP